MSEGTREQREQGPQGGRSGERGTEDRSSSESNTATVENDKGPKGLLAPCSTWTSSIRPTATRPPSSPGTPAITRVRREGVGEKGGG